jgi:hypothetical protein
LKVPKAVLRDALLVTLTALLAACTPSTPLATQETPTRTPPVSTPPLAPAAPTVAAPAGPSGYINYQNLPLGIRFSFPATWHLQETARGTTLTSFDPSNPPHKLEWTDETVAIELSPQELARPFATFDAWVESVRQEALAQHLDIPSVERFQIAGQPAARLTLVSGSGGIINRVLTVLNGRHFVIDIQGNYAAAEEMLASLEVLDGAGTAK